MHSKESGELTLLIVLTIILFGLFFGLFFACAKIGKDMSVEANALESNGYFVELSDEYDGAVVYDTRTGVEYWRSDSAYSRGVLTMLYDADGKPLVYEGK